MFVLIASSKRLLLKKWRIENPSKDFKTGKSLYKGKKINDGRRQMKKSMTAVLFILIFVVGVSAQEEEVKPEKNWSNEAELSLVSTSGNTEVSTFAGKNAFKVKFADALEGQWDIEALKSRSVDKAAGKTETTAERYFTNLKLSYLFTERIYSGIGAGWLRDEFAGLANKYYAGPFMGYKFLLGPKHFLDGELGLNYAIEDYTAEKEAENFEDKNFWEGRAFGLYEYVITDKTKISQSLEYLYDFDDSDNYKVNSLSEVTVSISDIISIKTSYEIRYANQVPVDIETTDRILTVGLLASL
jgi:putative salt-induced outer membrane protein